MTSPLFTTQWRHKLFWLMKRLPWHHHWELSTQWRHLKLFIYLYLLRSQWISGFIIVDITDSLRYGINVDKKYKIIQNYKYIKFRFGITLDMINPKHQAILNLLFMSKIWTLCSWMKFKKGNCLWKIITVGRLHS